MNSPSLIRAEYKSKGVDVDKLDKEFNEIRQEIVDREEEKRQAKKIIPRLLRIWKGQ